MNIKIISDSTCDLPASLLEQYDITLAPLTVVKNDEQFKDGVTITPADIFAHVSAGGDLCTTAAVSIGEYEDLFAQFSKDYDAIIHINIGSGFSACHQNACLAAEEFDNVRCIDSMNLTAGQGLLVLKACQLAKEMEDLDALCDALKEYTNNIETSFLVDKLDYLVKGGRCSSAAALGANLLNLKPCIEVKDGKMTVVKKYRGSFAKSLGSYIKERIADREDLEPDMAFLPQTVVSEEAQQAVEEVLSTYGKFNQVLPTIAGCTVSCHCGPGTLGIAFVRK